MLSILGLTIACCSVVCRVWRLMENTLKSKHSLPGGVVAMFRYYNKFFIEECDPNISVSLRFAPFSLLLCAVSGLTLFPLLNWG